MTQRRYQFKAGSALLLLSLAGAAVLAGRAQNSSGNSPRVTTGNVESGESRENPGLDPRFQERLEQRRNEDRHKQLVADTSKLLQLAQQLQQEVDKSNKDQLSLSVLKKSEEIEKLAKSVKDKMRGY